MVVTAKRAVFDVLSHATILVMTHPLAKATTRAMTALARR